MAVTANGYVSAQASSASSVSVSVTPASGEGLLIFVGVYKEYATPTVSHVKFNATESATAAYSWTYSTNWQMAIYTLPSASATTSDVVTTISEVCDSVFVAVVRVSGHDTAAMVSATNTSTGASSAPSVTVPSASDALVVDAALIRDANGIFSSIAAGAGQTALGYVVAFSNGTRRLYTSAELATGATTTMDWSSSGGEESWAAMGVAIAPSAGGDITAPTLTSPAASATGQTTANGSVSTDEGNGTLYWLASANASETAATVKGGSSQAVSATGTQSVSVTGLTAATSYYLHFVHRDAALNDSAVATSTQFTTSAAVIKGVRIQLYDGATAQASMTGLTVAWFDDDDPATMGAPVYQAVTETTDVTGWLELPLDGYTALAVGASGFLLVYKAGATAADDIVFAGRLAVQDIA